MCESCKNYSNEKCVKFFAIWNMVWGAFFTFACGGAVYEMHTGEKQTIVTQIFTYCGVVCAPIYLLSGILIYFGDKRDSQGMFKLGLYLSNPLPVVLFTTIFMPIVHFIALMRLCKYYRERWE